MRRLDGSLEVLMRVLVLCGLLASTFHFPWCKNLLDPRDPDSALFLKDAKSIANLMSFQRKDTSKVIVIEGRTFRNYF